MNLYQHSQLATLESHVDKETGEIDIDAFNSAEIAHKEKQQAVVAYLKNQAAAIKMVDEAIKELAARKKSMVSRHDGLKDYLLVDMKHHGDDEVNAPDHTFSAKIKKNPPKLVIDDAGQIPTDMYIYPEAPPPTPDNAAIKAALKEGQEISGAHLEQGERLDIK